MIQAAPRTGRFHLVCPRRSSWLGVAALVVLATPAAGQFQVPRGYGNGNGGFAPPPGSNYPGAGAADGRASSPAARVAAAAGTAAGNLAPAGSPSIPSAIDLGAAPSGDAAEDSDAAAPGWVGRVWSKVSTGGPLMIPLGVCWMVVVTLSLERLMTLRRSRVIPRPFVRRFTECVEDGQLSYDEATSICEEFQCPVAEVFHAAVKRWGRPMLEVEQAVMDAGDRVAESLRRFLRVFHAISNVAPLLGLLGTVIGMIEAFESMSGSGATDRPVTLASGISMALVTTAAGLSVAIPAYLAYMYFASKSDRYLGEIDRLCQRIVECISAETLENEKGRKRRTAA